MASEDLKSGLLVSHILRKIFLEDGITKLVALAITLALWLGVTGLSETGSDRYKVPLILRLADNADTTNEPVGQVEIRVGGDKRRLGQIRESDLRVFVDLTNTPPGSHTVSLAPDTVLLDLPTGLKLEDIQPNKIAVRLEAVEEKEITVNVDTQGEPADGFEVYSKAVTPSRIRVRGPSSYLRTLSAVSTEKIGLAGKTSSFTAGQIRIAPLANDKATPLDSVVDVSFLIGEERVQRVFSVPIVDASGKRTPVTLFGPASILDSLKPETIRVEQRKDASGTDAWRVQLPDDVAGQVEIRKPKVGSQ
jgi:hypothetical protein